MKRGSVRTLPVLLLTAGIVASLSACATTPFADGCDSTIVSGSASSVVTATGDLGTKPNVTFPTPIVTKTMERTELIPGDGPELAAGDVVLIKFTVLNGSTGDVVAQGDYSGLGAIITLGDSPTLAVSEGLECATVGSRVAVAANAKDSGQNVSAVTDSFVFVVDIMDAYSGKAYGVPQAPQSGIPAVVTAPNGTPGVTVPKQDPPTTLTVNVLRQADGDTLKAGDHAVLKYTALLWSDSSVFKSTWTGGQADIITLAPSEKSTQGLVEGLVGQKIGSQVIIIAPPAVGYGDTGAAGVPPGSTLIYVVDILGAVG